MKVTSMLAAVVLVASPISAQEPESPDAIAVAEKQLDKGIEEIREQMSKMFTQSDVLFDAKKFDEATQVQENWKTVKGHWFTLRMYTNILYLYRQAKCKEDQRLTHLVIHQLKKEVTEPMKIDVGYWKKSIKGQESSSINKTLSEVIETEERIIAAVNKITFPQK